MLICIPSHDRRPSKSALHLVSLIFVVASMLGATSNADNTSTGNSDRCSIELPEDLDWTPTEVWAWNRLCHGRSAYLSELDPAPSDSEHKKAVCDPE